MKNDYLSGRSTMGGRSSSFGGFGSSMKGSSSGKQDPYFNAQSTINDATDTIGKAMDKTAGAIAGFIKELNKSGASGTKPIMDQVSTLLRDFSPEQKEAILIKAIALIAVGL